MSAVALGLAWLYSTLSGDGTLTGIATGGVYRFVAPQGAVPPWITITPASLRDVLTMNANRIYSDDVFQIKAVGLQTTFDSALIPATNRIDALLSVSRNVIVSGGIILAAFREQEFFYEELVGGTALWNHIGGIYRLQVE